MTNIDYSKTLVYEFDGKQEFLAYCRVHEKELIDKQIIWSKGTDYIDLYKKGHNLNKKKEFKKAIKEFERALEFNPIGLASRFEEVESYVGLEDYKKAKETLLSMSNILTSDSLIARFYRRLGLVSLEEEKYDCSYSCFMQSNKYEEKEQTKKTLDYILYKSSVNPKINIEKTLKDNNIPIIKKIGKLNSDATLINEEDNYVFSFEDATENKVEPKTDTICAKTNKTIYCRKCGVKLNNETTYCHKCATKIEEFEHKNFRHKKKCADCGKSLPKDSNYCQFCGSNRIINNDKKESKNKEETKNTRNVGMVPFIIVCCLSCLAIAGCFALHMYYSNQISDFESQIASKNKQISDLNTKVGTAENKAATYKEKSTKYDIVMKIANQTIYSDFRASSYVVKGSSSTVKIYCNFQGSYTVSPEVTSGSGIGWSWGDWVGSGYNCYCNMYITCRYGSSGVITFKNSKNNHTFKIYVSGN